MKFILEMNGVKLLLTVAQVEAVAEILHGSEMVDHKYMGSKAGKGTDYVDLVRPADMREYLKMSLITDAGYDAMVFVTKQLDGEK